MARSTRTRFDTKLFRSSVGSEPRVCVETRCEPRINILAWTRRTESLTERYHYRRGGTFYGHEYIFNTSSSTRPIVIFRRSSRSNDWIFMRTVHSPRAADFDVSSPRVDERLPVHEPSISEYLHTWMDVELYIPAR